MYAYWSEVNGISSIWGNHPLGHFILNSVYVISTSFGYQGKALSFQIITNGIIGGLTVAIFFITTHKLLRINFLNSLGFSIIFGVSYSFWHYSGSAEIYSFSILLLLLSWASISYEIFHRESRFLYFSGLFAGLSILAHQLNSVFLFVGLLMILVQGNYKSTRFVSFLGSVLSTVATGFLLLGYVATSSFSITDIFHWARGYIGDSIYGKYLQFEYLSTAWKTALRTVIVPTTGRSRFVRSGIYSILIGSVIFGFLQIKLLDRKKQIILISAFIQCVISWLFIIWFSPSNPSFWLLTLLPGMILFSYSIDALEMRISLGFVKVSQRQAFLSIFFILMGFVIFVFNFKYGIINEHRTDELSQKSLNIWLDHSRQNDMLITAGDLIPQLWFWANRPNTVHLYHYLEVDQYSDDRFAYLRSEIDRFICSDNLVIFAPDIVNNFHAPFLNWLDLSRAELRDFFDAYPKDKFFTYRNLINGEDAQVYILQSPDDCGN